MFTLIFQLTVDFLTLNLNADVGVDVYGVDVNVGVDVGQICYYTRVNLRSLLYCQLAICVMSDRA